MTSPAKTAPGNLIVLGAGGHGKVVADLALAAGYCVLGFVDDRAPSAPLPGYALLGRISDLASLFAEEPAARLAVAVGDNRIRMDLAARCAVGDDLFPTLVHPASAISSFACLGWGTVVLPGAVVNAGTLVGRHVILNSGCSVDHDCRIGDFAHISPGAHLAGNVRVGLGAQVGIGASVIQGVRIGEWSLVGAGSVVLEDVPSGVVVAGIPARKLRDV